MLEVFSMHSPKPQGVHAVPWTGQNLPYVPPVIAYDSLYIAQL